MANDTAVQRWGEDLPAATAAWAAVVPPSALNPPGGEDQASKALARRSAVKTVCGVRGGTAITSPVPTRSRETPIAGMSIGKGPGETRNKRKQDNEAGEKDDHSSHG